MNDKVDKTDLEKMREELRESIKGAYNQKELCKKVAEIEKSVNQCQRSLKEYDDANIIKTLGALQEYQKYVATKEETEKEV